MLDSEIVKLNIGGSQFSTLRSTLTKKIQDQNNKFYPPNLFDSLLNGIIQPIYDENNAIFIDRDPKLFNHILNYLRKVDLNNIYEIPSDVNLKELNEEAKYYQIKSLEDLTNVKKPAKIDSLILDDQQIRDLYSLCEFGHRIKWKLLYRATRDGYGAQNFHDKCDNETNTLTVVKTNDAYIFGGYTEQAWDCSEGYKTDNDAFIFSLVNHQGLKEIFDIAIPNNAIYCHTEYGPTFGGGPDLHICSNSNTNKECFSKLGHSYKNRNSDKNLLANQTKFQTTEIEVFKKI